MQEKRVRSLIWEDPTCRRAAKPQGHNCKKACALGSVCSGLAPHSHSLCLAGEAAAVARAHAARDNHNAHRHN